MSGLDPRRPGIQLWPYLVLVCIHLASGLPVEQPLILADEVGYLGNARYLSGVAHMPDMRGTGFYHFGYSLFLLPAFWLFAEPEWVYRAAIATNALLVSALYFPLRFILVSTLGLSSTPARWIAFSCCLYPSLVLYSSLAWAESAFVPLYAVAVALFARLLASRSSGDVLLFALVAGFLYTVHPRALPILAVAVAFLALLTALRALTVRQLLLGLTTMAALFGVTRQVSRHLKAVAWGGSGELSAVKLAGRLVPDADLPALAERAAGQLLYLSLASHGLFLVGLVAMIWLFVGRVRSGTLRKALSAPASGVPLFVLLSGAGVFVAACTLKLYSLHGEHGVRGAEFIHGRYNEALGVLGIAFGLAQWWRGGGRRGQVIWRALLVGLVIFFLTWVVMAEVNDAARRQVAEVPGAEPQELVLPSQVDAVAVPGVYPLVLWFGGLNLWGISAVVIGSFALITVAMQLSQRTGVVVLMLLFAGFAYYNHRHDLLARISRAQPRLAMAEEMRRITQGAKVSYDGSCREPGLVPAMQFLVPDSVFVRFDGRRGERPATEAVIGCADWSQAQALDARFVISSGRGGAFWLLPGEMRSYLPVATYDGVTLGAARRLDLQESGFYRDETFGSRPARWTNGAATLRVPLDPRRLPRALEIETLAPGRDRARMQLLANGVELWSGKIPRTAWSKTFSLEPVPLGEELLVEINSDTFTPAERQPSTRDRRRLGIVVLGIRLRGELPAAP